MRVADGRSWYSVNRPRKNETEAIIQSPEELGIKSGNIWSKIIPIAPTMSHKPRAASCLARFFASKTYDTGHFTDHFLK